MPLDLKVLDEQEALAAISRDDVRKALREAFGGLDGNRTVQPAQTLTQFPDDEGDCIFYPGVIYGLDIVGVKVSPYINALKRNGKYPVTAYTLLLSASTGRPIVLCDSYALTTIRTAATTALALEYLTPPTASKLAIIGTGKVAIEHLRFVASQHDWDEIKIWSPSMSTDGARAKAVSDLVEAISPKATVAKSLKATIADANVVMLCTSSGSPVVRTADLPQDCVVTSISTNAPRAHEIDPAELGAYSVFCDYAQTAPVTAGEMIIAQQSGAWSPSSIKGDLAGLVTGKVQRPQRGLVFFRSTGLGIEDLAVANLLR
ncbi:ornithine cyclodeaminase [Caulobacter sp. D4A]|uniref:ornithine cyclodeaminase family protein n=1 Tax=unclassified Caulobacter TaxID=2648921 RepID=UPI000D72DF71|nr:MULTISPECIES: ornithine cyclodeaminase family protein [unclassified Caulobacter]PXA77592.1 ornithine cyclodeaminase [Caulobacter sp. D4A]PXA96173.1 ornithine cyclodeaminase [Caulobacter sp. D5]